MRRTWGIAIALILCTSIFAMPAKAVQAAMPAVIPNIVIAAPWDENITYTLTNVYALCFHYEAGYATGEGFGFSIFGTPDSTVVISHDVAWFHDEAMEKGVLNGGVTYKISELYTMYGPGTNDILGQKPGHISLSVVSDTQSAWFSDNAHRTVDLRQFAVNATAPAAPAASAGQTGVTFNGQALNFDLPIINRGGRTFYPMRELLEAIGAIVEWNEQARTAVGYLGDNWVEFPIGSNSYIVNDETRYMDAGLTSFVENGRTYLPVRFAVEALGLSVDWDADTSTIVIASGDE